MNRYQMTPPPEEVAGTDAGEIEAAIEVSAEPAPPRTVLIVDDDLVILKTTSMTLQEAGYAVVTASDSTAAIAAFRKYTVDVLLLDINFPPDVANGGIGGWDGLQLMQWLRSLPEAKDVRFIIISGDDAAKWQNHPVAAAAAGFFQKPIDHAQLLAFLAGEFQGEAPAPAADPNDQP